MSMVGKQSSLLYQPVFLLCFVQRGMKYLEDNVCGERHNDRRIFLQC